MSIKIEVPSEDCVQRRKSAQKGGGVFYTQTAYAHTLNRDGQLHQYPQRIELYVQVGDDGHPQPYPIGEYTLAPTSFYVRGDRLEMFTRLKPLKQQAQTPVKAAS